MDKKEGVYEKSSKKIRDASRETEQRKEKLETT